MNAVLALRSQALSVSTKAFNARGAKLRRCNECLLAIPHCICAQKPALQKGAAFCLLMYTGEAFKPSNTGRLIADVMAETYAFQWQRTSVEPALIQLLNHPDYAPILIFPQQYVTPERHLVTQTAIQERLGSKKPLLILLDGTWREAKKMSKSAYLQMLPVLGIQPERSSDYFLREAAQPYQLCTAEVAALVLTQLGQAEAGRMLQDYFQIFKGAYLKTKPHRKKVITALG